MLYRYALFQQEMSVGSEEGEELFGRFASAARLSIVLISHHTVAVHEAAMPVVDIVDGCGLFGAETLGEPAFC